MGKSVGVVAFVLLSVSWVACNREPPPAVGKIESALCMGTPCNGGTCGTGLTCAGGCCVMSCRSCSSGCQPNEQCDGATNCCVPPSSNQSCYNNGGYSVDCSGVPCGAPIGQAGYCAQGCNPGNNGDECCYLTGCRGPTNTYRACMNNGSNHVCTGPTLCVGAFADCNGNPNDGCETAIDQPTSCGDCPNNPEAMCNAPAHHALFASCAQVSLGQWGCQYSGCQSGYGDCNATPSDGCEADLATVANCGSCNHNCAAGGTPPGGVWTCPSQNCILTCPGKTLCGNTCVDTNNDPNNCGGCNIKCDTVHSTGATCAAGHCFYSGCVDGYKDCLGPGTNSDGCEQNITSVMNCGDCPGVPVANCTNYHQAAPSCQRLGPGNYQCAASACSMGYYDCSSGLGCETYCGAPAPNGHFSCTPVPCTFGCDSGYTGCGGSNCFNLMTDPAHCGGCTNVCSFSNTTPVHSCTGGVCTGTCLPGYLDCDTTNANSNGCETSYSINNCGSCGHKCTAAGGTAVCSVTGVCTPVCDATHSNCDGNGDNGCEQVSDVTHCGGSTCGACDTTHSTPTNCTGNICQYTCLSGYADCVKTGANLDGCETPQNATHCTAACIACPTPPHTTGATCQADACGYLACLPGYADCNGIASDGCEVHTDVDADHCGGCDTVCPAAARGSPACVGGSCTAMCELDASVALKVCGTDGGISCNECCVDADCKSPPDKCHPGSCVSGFCAYPAKSCVVVDCYSTPSCNPANGNCESTPLTGGTCGGKICYANNATGTCANGACVDGSGNPLQQITCPGAGPCKLGVCDNTGECTFSDALNDSACTPDDKCLVDGTCTNGVCNGTPKVCTTTATCRTSQCNSTSGACEDQLAPAGVPCSTGQACVQNEACDNTGACVGTELPNGTPCSLSDCTTSASCQTGVCTCDAAVDQAQPETPTDMVPVVTPDMTVIGHSKHGCAMGGEGSAGWGWLAVLWLLARRRRGD